MLLLVDNGSAYTDELDSVLGRACGEHARLGPDRIDTDSLSGYGAFVLSGRRAPDRDTNRINARIVRAALARRAPLLGICYGAEAIALACGGAIRRMGAPRRGERDVDVVQENALCSGRIRVFESHAYEISTLPRNAVALAGSAECANEVIRLAGTDVYGTQFHPEMSGDGRRIVEAFAALCP